MSEQIVAGEGLEQLLSLEEKIQQTIQLLKATRAENERLQRENAELQQELDEQTRTGRALQDRVGRLEKEREAVRARVQRLMDQVDAVTAVGAEA